MTDDPEFSDLHSRIRREHEEMRALLGSLQRSLAERTEPLAQVKALITSLTEHVQQHFADEETDGLFDRVVGQAPRLAQRANHLRAEHGQLIEALRLLLQSAGVGDESAEGWQQLEAQFHAFSKQLMQHEARENEILLDAYEQDIGSQD